MKEFWESFYKRPLDKIPWESTRRRWFHDLVDQGILHGKTALDVGCGTGRKSIYLAQHGFQEILGVDISNRAIEIAKQNAKEARVSNLCTFIQQDVTDSSFLEGERFFDLIIDWATIHCLARDELETYATKISDHCVNGGQLLIRTFSNVNGDEQFFEEEIDGLKTNVLLLTKSDIQSLFPKFHIIDQHESEPRVKKEFKHLEFLLQKTP